MGILDELKEEAEQARLNKSAEERRREESARIYREEMIPRMLDLHDFLHKLVSLLEESGRAVTADYEIPGIGKVEGMVQSDYSVSIDSGVTPQKIVLRFECNAPMERRYSVAPKRLADEASQFLRDQKILFTEWPQRDGVGQIMGAMFQARMKVRASIFFEADKENSCLYVITHNFENISTKHNRLGYQQINESWKDQLGRFLLRKSQHLLLPSMTDAERRALQARLALDKQLAEARMALDMAAEDAPDVGLFDGLRKRLFKPAR